MSTTLGNVLSALAYRLGEDSSPSNTNERARRVRYIVEGYKKIVAKMPFWWTEGDDSFNSVADQEEYTTSGGFPSDYRDMLELRVNGYLYTAIPKGKAFNLDNPSNNLFNYGNLAGGRYYYIFAGALHLTPSPSATAVDAITIKYFKTPTMPTLDADVLLIPDTYAPALDAFAYGRINQIKGRRGEAADGFNEFTDLLKDMISEHNRQAFWNKSARPIDPVYLVN